jgi:hypothetical protein
MFARIKEWWKLDKPRALPMDFCSKEGDYTWEDWQREAADKHPIRYAIQERLPTQVYVHVLKPLENFFYWIRTHTYNRYHMLNLKSPQNRYEWGWLDRDQAIVFACFNILKAYVEREMSQISYYAPATEWCPEYDRRDEEKEIMELYDWWTVGRRKNLDENPNYLDEDDDEDEDTVMLARLMKIRRTLWS